MLIWMPVRAMRAILQRVQCAVIALHPAVNVLPVGVITHRSLCNAYRKSSSWRGPCLQTYCRMGYNKSVSKNDLKTGQIFSSVQPVTRGVETFLFPVQQSGRSPDLQIIMHCPLPGCPVSFWHALPKYSDEFVQDSHLFPFSPDPAE